MPGARGCDACGSCPKSQTTVRTQALLSEAPRAPSFARSNSIALVACRIPVLRPQHSFEQG